MLGGEGGDERSGVATGDRMPAGLSDISSERQLACAQPRALVHAYQSASPPDFSGFEAEGAMAREKDPGVQTWDEKRDTDAQDNASEE